MPWHTQMQSIFPFMIEWNCKKNRIKTNNMSSLYHYVMINIFFDL